MKKFLIVIGSMYFLFEVIFLSTACDITKLEPTATPFFKEWKK